MEELAKKSELIISKDKLQKNKLQLKCNFSENSDLLQYNQQKHIW